jgi:hypothetical protein
MGGNSVHGHELLEIANPAFRNGRSERIPVPIHATPRKRLWKAHLELD